MDYHLLFKNKTFSKLKKQLNYFNLSDYYKIIVYGENCNNLINSLSIRNIDNIISTSFFSILMKKNKFIDEVIIIKLSKYKYLIISKSVKTYNTLKNLSNTIYPSTTTSLINNLYIYSIHGDLSKLKPNKHTYNVSHQGYNYKIYMSLDQNQLIKDNPSIFKLTVANYKLFLYNNNVVTNFNIKNKNIKLNLIKALYSADNYKFKCKPIFLFVKQFESSFNFIPAKQTALYDINNNKIGILYNYFRLQNKKYPFIIAILKKYTNYKHVYIKDKISKEKIILKYRPIYN